MFSTSSSTTQPKRRLRLNFKPLGVALGFALIGFILVSGFITMGNAYRTEVRHVDCVVESTTHFAYDPASKQTVKRVVTENCGTFNIGTDLGRGQFLPQMNEMMEQLEVGQSYTFTAVGIDNPLLANYPNIIKIEQ